MKRTSSVGQRAGSPLRRAAEVRARAAEIVRKTERLLSDDPAPSTPALLAATIGSFRDMAGPNAPLPPPLSALRNREETERMSREGRTVREIADALGISYGYVVDLRKELGVSRRRTPALSGRSVTSKTPLKGDASSPEMDVR